MADPPVDLPEPILPPEGPGPLPEPQPATPAGILHLRPGSNALVAVAPQSSIAAEHKLMILADAIGAAAGATPTYVGKRLGYKLWTIGAARPVTLRAIGTTKALVEWYRGTPGANIEEPEFFSVNIDWRGPTSDLQWPGGMFALPAAVTPTHGEANWPDMTPEEYAQALRAAAANETIARVARQVEEHVGGPIGSTVLSVIKWTAIGLGVVGGIVIVGKLMTLRGERDD